MLLARVPVPGVPGLSKTGLAWVHRNRGKELGEPVRVRIW